MSLRCKEAVTTALWKMPSIPRGTCWQTRRWDRIHYLYYVFLSKLATELGFVSEAAQTFVLKGSDHHKTKSVLNVAHNGLWKELLIPYIRNRFSSEAAISVNDYLYKWIP